MCTNCTSLPVDMFHYSYRKDSMQNLVKYGENTHSNHPTPRIDINLVNPTFGGYVNVIYLSALEIKATNDQLCIKFRRMSHL